MTAPVIVSVTPPGPITVPVGVQTVFTVVAKDADARTETLQISAVDDASGETSALATVQLIFTDAVTIKASIKETGSPTKVTVAGNVVTVVG